MHTHSFGQTGIPASSDATPEHTQFISCPAMFTVTGQMESLEFGET